MKNLILGSLLFVAVAAAGLPQNSSAQTPPAPAADPAPPVVPPPDILPGSPLAEVVRLTQGGVDQGVIMTYITNSRSTFNLDSDRIIYLSNLGLPNNLITAMMQRDQQLQQQFTAQPTPPVQTPPAPAPQTTAPPGTTEDATQPETQPAPVTVDYFNDTLTPYGDWVVVNGYGRCWRPTAVAYDPNWQPYCDRGHWVYTDCGWYWSSEYAWGATFHYGRWFRDTSVGWCWYPDTVWAPSWVTWRYSDDYCGWAPLPPRTYLQPGVGIVYQGSSVSVGFNFGLAANCFTFVPTGRFCDPHPRNFRAAPTQVTQIFNRTKVINNIRVNGNGNNVIVNNGIAVQNVAAASKMPIHPVPVRQIDRSFTHDTHLQPFDRRNSSAPAQSPIGQQPAHSVIINGNGNNHPAENHFQQPALNQNQTPHQTVTAPQTTPPPFSRARTDFNNPAPAISQNPGPAHDATVQTPPADSGQHSRNAETRQNLAAQNPAANYSAPQSSQHSQILVQPRNAMRQNYSPPAVVAAPQPTAPGNASAQPSSQPDGGHNDGGHDGNKIWGH
jgi:hypothetical protein